MRSHCRSTSTDPRHGFSLIEMLVVLGLTGLLFGLALPAVQQVRGAAARASCQNNLRQVAVALHAYHATHGRLPATRVDPKAGAVPDTTLGWMALILPQMEGEAVYRGAETALRADPDPTHNPPHTGLQAVIGGYTCPADARLTRPQPDSIGLVVAFTSFVGIAGSINGRDRVARAGVFGDDVGTRLTDVSDGTSQTIMLGERPPPGNFQAGWWYPGAVGAGGFRGPNHYLTLGAPALVFGDPCTPSGRSLGVGRLDNPCDRYHLWSLHSGGANFAFCDGSVRFLPIAADALLPALASRAGGESVQLPD